MQSNEEKDFLWMRKMASLGVFKHKSGSRKKGQVWQQIAFIQIFL